MPKDKKRKKPKKAFADKAKPFADLYPEPLCSLIKKGAKMLRGPKR